jgi:glycosyltransferase involved in cell wall biosynthesis
MVGDDQGRTEYRAEVEAAIVEKNLEGHVRIIGQCNDMPAAYMLSNVVVSASTDPEGFGRVPIEAQAMGRPVVATRHGGAMETILEGETGWLVEPGNAEDLAKAIGKALSMDDIQKYDMAAKAMEHIADHFTKTQMVEQTLDVYADLLRVSYADKMEPVKKPKDIAA